MKPEATHLIDNAPIEGVLAEQLLLSVAGFIKHYCVRARRFRRETGVGSHRFWKQLTLAFAVCTKTCPGFMTYAYAIEYNQ